MRAGTGVELTTKRCHSKIDEPVGRVGDEKDFFARLVEASEKLFDVDGGGRGQVVDIVDAHARIVNGKQVVVDGLYNLAMK